MMWNSFSSGSAGGQDCGKIGFFWKPTQKFIRVAESTNDLCLRVRFVNEAAPEGLQSPINYAEMVIRASADTIE